ncbi:MAG: phage portal protein, partial [Halanaerobiales bacterium]|nr:phage portal protein [Halanaerobiales bacterium]
MYLTSPTAFAGIEAIVFSVLSAGFEIEHESEEIKKRYTRRFDKIYPKLYSVLTNALVFGDSYTKIIEGKDNFVTDLELFFPPDVTIKDDKYYVKEKGKIVPLKNIWQFQLMPRSDKSYGISLLGIAREPLEWKTEIDEAVTEAIKRHGFSKYHIICSKDDRGLYPDDNRLRELERQFRKIHVGHEFVSTDKINIKPIDTSGFPALLDYLQYFTNLAATGLMVPAEVLGQGASAATFATAKVRMEHFQKRVIPYFQQVLECSINEYLLGENAEGALFHFKEPVPLSMKTEEY